MVGPKVWVPLLIFVATSISGTVAHEIGQEKAITQNSAADLQEDERYNATLREMNRRMDERDERIHMILKELKDETKELRSDVKGLIREVGRHGP